MISSDLRQLIHSTIGEWNAHGFSIAIVQKTQAGEWEVDVEGFGKRDSTEPVDEETMFSLASNSKLFTALSVSMIIAQSSGQIKYTTRLRDLIPDFSMKDELASERVTLEDLLCHRSGLGRFNDFIKYDSLDDITFAMSTSTTTGKPHQVAADIRAYDLLALVVQRVSGIAYHTFVQQNILDPLGMTDTTFQLDKAQTAGNVATGYWRRGETVDSAGEDIALENGMNMGMGLKGAGGMMTNAKDMAIWLQALLEQGGAGLPDDSIRQFFKDSIKGRSIVDVLGETSDLSPKLYGLARRIGSYQGVEFIEHGGAVSGHMSQVCVVPDHGFGIAIMTNSSPWGDLAYNIIKWRLFEEKCGLTRVDWNARYKQRRQRELKAASPDYILPPAVDSPVPALVNATELCGTYKTGGLSIDVSKVVPRSEFPQLEILPFFTKMWGDVTIVLAHRSGTIYDGCLELTPLGQPGVKIHGKHMTVTVDVEGGSVKGLGIKGKGIIGAPITRTSQPRPDICLYLQPPV